MDKIATKKKSDSAQYVRPSKAKTQKRKRTTKKVTMRKTAARKLERAVKKTVARKAAARKLRRTAKKIVRKTKKQVTAKKRARAHQKKRVYAALYGRVRKGKKQGIKGKSKQQLLSELSVRLCMESQLVEVHEILLERLPSGIDPDIRKEVEHSRQVHYRHVGMLVSTIKKAGGDPCFEAPLARVLQDAIQCIIKELKASNINVYEAFRLALIVQGANSQGWEILLSLVSKHGLSAIKDELADALQEEKREIRHFEKLIGARAGDDEYGLK